MRIKEMSLANIQGKLSRAEMKNIMAGSGDVICTACSSDSDCSSGHICISSPSCFAPKVCALPYYV